MVDGSTWRNRATSLVVHQSRGRGWVTATRLQRLRCFIAGGALGPDDGDRYVALSRFGGDVSVAAIPAGGFAVPYREQPVGGVQHDVAGFHMRFLSRLNAVEPVHAGGFREQLVVAGVGGFGKPVAIEGGGDDDFQLAACVEHGLGEELVRAVGNIAHADYVLASVCGELLTDGLVHELLGGGREPPVSRDRYVHQVPPVA